MDPLSIRQTTDSLCWLLGLGSSSALEQQRLLCHLGERAVALCADVVFERSSWYMDNQSGRLQMAHTAQTTNDLLPTFRPCPTLMATSTTLHCTLDTLCPWLLASVMLQLLLLEIAVVAMGFTAPSFRPHHGFPLQDQVVVWHLSLPWLGASSSPSPPSPS